MANEMSYTGRIWATPEWKDVASGLLNIQIAETHQRKNKESGQWEDFSTTWHRVAVWGDNAHELAANPDINKGALVEVSVRYESDKEPWTDKNGNKRVNLNETANYVRVKFPPKDSQPAVKAAGGDGFTPDDFGGGF